MRGRCQSAGRDFPTSTGTSAYSTGPTSFRPGERTPATKERFLLGDAQFVLAQEYGFRTWAGFRAHVEGRAGVEDRPVSRLMGVRPGVYDSMAALLLAEVRRDDPGALRRLRAYVPRHAAATSGAAAGLPDARLIIARELGFPTWRELVAFTEKSQRDLGERRDRQRLLRREAGAVLSGDLDLLTDLTPQQADTLLHLVAGPEAPDGTRFGKRLGAPHPAVAVLVAKATDLELPLARAACFDRVDLVRLLLGAGADPASRERGVTALENAIYHNHTAVVDLLAERTIAPRALWTYAACGRLDLVRACFGPDGALLPGAASSRPDLADTGAGFPSRLPPSDDREEIVGEAFVHACQHGRVEVVRWFLDHGVHPDVAPYLGRTGLHWAIQSGRPRVVRLLVERGADPSVRDDLLRLDAAGWLGIAFAGRPDDPVARRLHDLVRPR